MWALGVRAFFMSVIDSKQANGNIMRGEKTELAPEAGISETKWLSWKTHDICQLSTCMANLNELRLEDNPFCFTFSFPS